MTLSYELRVHSRDVNVLGVVIGQHVGYDVIIRDETNNIINIQSVDLMGTSPINGSIYFANFSGSDYIQSGNIIAPTKAYKDGKWQTIDAQWLEDNHYKSFSIPLENNKTIDTLNHIKLFGDLVNKLNSSGIKFDYEASGQNCNSFADYINKKFFPNIDIWDTLGEGNYLGQNYPFGLLDQLSNNNLLQTIEEILNYLEENNLTLDDIQLNITASVFGYDLTINNGEETLVFSSLTLQLPPIITLSQLYSTAEKTTSPLVVDLDGDGVETIGTQAGVHFDHDGNGFAEKTGWVGKDDGLLVRDINGNGQIDKLHLKQQECNLNLAA